MAHKSATQPLCHCCGKPIAKRTAYMIVRDQYTVRQIDVVEGPLYSKADCQRTTNHPVVGIRYWNPDKDGRRRVMSFSTWDGESYIDEFFCKGSCATQFAYVMARAGRCTNHYNEAIQRQKERAI